MTFTAFCRTETGKHLSGMELRKRRKSSWMTASGAEKPLMTASILNIHDAARWQFCVCVCLCVCVYECVYVFECMCVCVRACVCL